MKNLTGKLLASLMCGALLCSSPASAEMLCAPIPEMLAMLQGKYGENLRAAGFANDEAVMSLFASDATGTWSILVTLDNGQMCLLASGVGYEQIPVGDPA